MRLLLLIAGSVFYLFGQNTGFFKSNDIIVSDSTKAETITYETANTPYVTHESRVDNYTPDNNPVTWDEDPDNYPLETPDTYYNIDNDEVQSPTHYDEVPPGACARCSDGTYSFSKNRRGTCSHHGGVAQWLK